MKRTTCLICVLPLFLLFSCTSLIYLSDTPDDLSFPVLSAQVLEEGSLYFKRPRVSIWKKKQDFSLLSDGIICDGIIASPILTGGITNTIFGYEKEYYWEGVIRFSAKVKSNNTILFTLISNQADGGERYGKNIEFENKTKSTISNTAFDTADSICVFMPAVELTHKLEQFKMPFKVAECRTSFDTYKIYAVYADMWLNSDNQIYKNFQGTVRGVENVLTMRQKYQVLDSNNTVVADIEGNAYRIYGTVLDADIYAIKSTLGILFSLINIYDIVYTTEGWLR